MPVLGFDVSNYSGSPVLDTVRALVMSEDFQFVLIAAQFKETFAAWYDVCNRLSLGVSAYIELYDGSSLTSQITQGLQNIDGALVDEIFLACEDQLTLTADQQAELTDYVAQYEVEPWKVELGIYTRKDYWVTHGNLQLGRYVRLWSANYDTVPAITDENYGGWVRPTIKQYQANYQSYGYTIDLNVRNA